MDKPGGNKTSKEGVTTGTMQSLPCPWCNEILEDLEDFDLKVGSVLECDFCQGRFEITAKTHLIHLTAERES